MPQGYDLWLPLISQICLLMEEMYKQMSKGVFLLFSVVVESARSSFLPMTWRSWQAIALQKANLMAVCRSPTHLTQKWRDIFYNLYIFLMPETLKSVSTVSWSATSVVTNRKHKRVIRTARTDFICVCAGCVRVSLSLSVCAHACRVCTCFSFSLSLSLWMCVCILAI